MSQPSHATGATPKKTLTGRLAKLFRRTKRSSGNQQVCPELTQTSPKKKGFLKNVKKGLAKPFKTVKKPVSADSMPDLTQGKKVDVVKKKSQKGVRVCNEQYPHITGSYTNDLRAVLEAPDPLAENLNSSMPPNKDYGAASKLNFCIPPSNGNVCNNNFNMQPNNEFDAAKNNFNRPPNNENAAATRNNFNIQPNNEYTTAARNNFNGLSNDDYAIFTKCNFNIPPNREYGAASELNVDAPPERRYGAAARLDFSAPPDRENAGVANVNVNRQLKEEYDSATNIYCTIPPKRQDAARVDFNIPPNSEFTTTSDFSDFSFESDTYSSYTENDYSSVDSETIRILANQRRISWEERKRSSEKEVFV